MGSIDNLAIKTLHRVRKFWELFILIVLIGGTFITVWAVARPGNVFDPRRYAADNMCNVDGRTCSKPEEWEKGWIEARQAENINKAPVQNEYTSANPANDSSQGITQEAQIIRQAGESNEVNRSSIAAEEAAKKNDPVNKPVVTDPTLPPLLPTTAAIPTSAVQPTGGLTPTVASIILSPTAQPTVPTVTPTVATTSDAQARRAEFTKQCAKDLHLCPMIDPNTYQVVGWVPADEASFGTFEDAKLARQKLSIGDLRKYNIPELLSEDKLRSATADEMQKELTKAFSGAEGTKLIDQLKNTPSGSLVKLDSQGSAVKTKDGDIVLNSGETLNKQTQVALEKKYLEERVADAKTQDDTANAILASLAKKLEDCLKEGKTPDGTCGISKLTQAEKQKYDELTDDRKKEISSGQTFLNLQKGVTNSYNQEKLAIEALARGGTAAVTAQCVAERGEQSCHTTEQINYYIASLAQGFDSATGDKIKAAYANKKKEEDEKFIVKLHDGDITRVRQDIEKNIEQAASIFISITVKPEDRNQAVRQLVYGNIDFSKYPNLTGAEKQEFQKDYFNRRYFAIQTYLTSDEIKNYQAEINVLKQELPKPGGGGGLKSIAKTPQTTQQLTPVQQAQLTAAQTGLGIVNWWNNTGLAQGINKKATDLGVINAQSPEESVGRFLNTTTAGAFGQYAATYADINAQNPDTSYLNKAFSPQGLDASQALLAQTVTATLPDNGQYSGQFVNGVFNAPLIGARRYIDAGVAGSTALANNNTGQLLQANAYGAYHIFGIDDTVNASNRLFYQTGMSSAEAEAYVNNPWLRAGDAVTVGMAAVSVGDVTASIKVSGLEKTLIQGPLSQRGVEQGFKNLANNIDEAKSFLKTNTGNWTSDYPMADVTGINRINNPTNYPEQYTKEFLLNTSAGGGIETNNPVVIKHIENLKEQIKDATATQDGAKLRDLSKEVDVLEKYEQLKRILSKMDKDRRERFIKQLSDQVVQEISGKDPAGNVVGLPKAKIYHDFAPLFATDPEKGFNIIEHDPDTAEFIADVGSKAVNKLYADNPGVPDPAFYELRDKVVDRLLKSRFFANLSDQVPAIPEGDIIFAVSETVNGMFDQSWAHTGTSLAKSISAPFLNDKPTAAALVCQGTANCYQAAQVTADLINSFNPQNPTKPDWLIKSGIPVKAVYIGPTSAKVVMTFDEIPHAAVIAKTDLINVSWVAPYKKTVIPGESLLVPYREFPSSISLSIQYAKERVLEKDFGSGVYIPSTLQFNR